MSCKTCQIFLHDFLLTGVPEGISFKKELRVKALPRVAWVFASWIYQFFHRLESRHFQHARRSASLIAKRQRSDVEYEFITSTATFNFLKYEVSWLHGEEELLAMYLAEMGLFRGKTMCGLMMLIKDYIRYNTIRAFYLLQQIHEDHVKPKGLMTSLDHLIIKKLPPKQETLYDIDTDDLYT